MGRRRVVITGLGVVAPNGIGKDAFWQSLVAGKSAVDYITAFDPTASPCKVAAEVRNFNPTDFISSRQAKVMGRFSHFAVAAARLAIEDARLAGHQLTHIGLCQGTSAQGICDLGEPAHRTFLDNGWSSVEPSTGLEWAAHAATVHVQAELEISGPALTIASGCCTGIDTIAWGAEQIRTGRIDVALTGAAEAPISEFIVSLFAVGGYLTKWDGPASKASRPYDLLRSGFVPGEGSVALVLEELDHALDRGASIFTEVLGYASASEGNSMNREKGYTTSLERAIRQALQVSSLTPKHIDYLCAHGNSIKIEDKAEAAAHRAALGSHAYRVPVTSIKSMIGQPFAASGLMQAAAATLAIQHQVVPPTINYEIPDPECDLDYVPNKARVVRIRHALFHAHSLGGHMPGTHSAMVIRKLN